MAISAKVPQWFTSAISYAPEHLKIEANGVSLNVRCWGRGGSPGIVLVHGGSAHSGWWDHIAPLLSDRHRVVALDLSGHGDSAHRAHYPMAGWAEEVVAAAQGCGIEGAPVVVGHSMGGWVAAAAGQAHSAAIAGLVIIDSPLFEAPPEEDIAWQMNRVAKTYATKAEICQRFRTEPRQKVLGFVSEHIASESVRWSEEGWRWKFDQAMFHKRREDGEHVSMRTILEDVRVPVVYVRCENGLVSRAMAADIADLIPGHISSIELAGAGHHPMMDQPLSLVALLRTVMAPRGAAMPI